jgi:hemerythrin superfamily protein
VTTGIDLILADHRRVEALFAAFDDSGDATLLGQIFDALAAHDDVEQGALYPLVAAVLGDEGLLDDALLAHSLVKLLIDEARSLEGAPLVAVARALQQAVADHVSSEEQRMLPTLAERATVAQLDGLGARIEQIKQRVG